MADRRRAGAGRLLTHLILLAGAAVMVFPFVWQFLTSLKTLSESTSAPPTLLPRHWRWDNYATFFDLMPVMSMTANSVMTLVLRVAGQLLFASLAAFVFARLRFRFRKPLLSAFLIVLMVPPQLFVIPQYEVIRQAGLLNTVPALALPGIFSAFGVFLLYQFMRTIPAEVDEAARLDGANPFQIYLRIVLPMCRPALAALTIMTALFSWNDLLWPLIVNTRPDMMTLPVGLATLHGVTMTDYPVLMAGSLLAILPMVLCFVLLQRQFIQGIAMSGSKG
ncbi:carbohydrate ABC transporter permease [Streptosporangium sp. NPDC004379]|uniref:carbohydrate ABC transporter permease n=1 Tax=Streptosporangium sp. NPDC004379 TaxID=3366189 RepID=UPI0036AD62D1